MIERHNKRLRKIIKVCQNKIITIKKIAVISIMLFLSAVILSCCMYLMEEDPWGWQRKSNERKRILKEQEIKKQQNTMTDTNSSQQN